SASTSSAMPPGGCSPIPKPSTITGCSMPPCAGFAAARISITPCTTPASPLGLIQNGIARLQDPFQAALHIEELPLPEDAPPRKPRPLNWDENLRKADALAKSLAERSQEAPKT